MNPDNRKIYRTKLFLFVQIQSQSFSRPPFDRLEQEDLDRGQVRPHRDSSRPQPHPRRRGHLRDDRIRVNLVFESIKNFVSSQFQRIIPIKDRFLTKPFIAETLNS